MRVIHSAANTRKLSAPLSANFSYHVYIDENGDAAGNYTVLARGKVRNGRNQTVLGLRPVGTFSHRNSSLSSTSETLPVSYPCYLSFAL